MAEETLVNQPPEDMGRLLQDVSPYKPPAQGQIVEGVVIRVNKDSLLVDLGLKFEGVVLGQEMKTLGAEGLSQVKVGDEVAAFVILPSNQDGQVILSLDKARGELGWRRVQQYSESSQVLDAKIIGYNKGGLLVNIEGIQGFVPLSQLTDTPPKEAATNPDDSPLAQRIGKGIKVKIIEIDRQRNRLILSERMAVREWREQQKEKLIEQLREGETRKGKVTSVHPFGVFIDLGGADGLIPFSELSWQPIKKAEEVVKVGEEVEVFVLKVDTAEKKIALSLRRMQPGPWDGIYEKFKMGQLVKGTVTKLTTFGAFARVENSVEGLVHISELAERRINHPKEVVKVGDVLNLKIINIDTQRRRLSLSLKQALEEEPVLG